MTILLVIVAFSLLVLLGILGMGLISIAVTWQHMQ